MAVDLNKTVSVVEQERLIKMIDTLQRYRQQQKFSRLNDQLPTKVCTQLIKIINKCQQMPSVDTLQNKTTTDCPVCNNPELEPTCYHNGVCYSCQGSGVVPA